MKNKRSKKIILALFMLAVAIVPLGAVLGACNNSTPTPEPPVPTLDMYLVRLVRLGQHADDVREIVGGDSQGALFLNTGTLRWARDGATLEVDFIANHVTGGRFTYAGRIFNLTPVIGWRPTVADGVLTRDGVLGLRRGFSPDNVIDIIGSPDINVIVLGSGAMIWERPQQNIDLTLTFAYGSLMAGAFDYGDYSWTFTFMTGWISG